MSTRFPDDLFLSYRSDSGTIHCLVYATVHDAIAQSATVFGFNPQWFKPHSRSTWLLRQYYAPLVVMTAIFLALNDGNKCPLR